MTCRSSAPWPSTITADQTVPHDHRIAAPPAAWSPNGTSSSASMTGDPCFSANSGSCAFSAANSAGYTDDKHVVVLHPSLLAVSPAGSLADFGQQRHRQLHGMLHRLLENRVQLSASPAGASTISSSWTWRISLAFSPAFCKAAGATRTMAILIRSAAVPCTGVFIAARSPN